MTHSAVICYNLGMMEKNRLSEQQINTVLAAFRETLEQGPWANSALLRMLGQKLQDLSDAFETEVGRENTTRSNKEKMDFASQKPTESQQEVFVALYSSDGANLKTWEHILANLPRQIISRPIYEKEEEIKQAIRARENPTNDGYAAVYIDKQNKLAVPADRAPKDRLGATLLTLKDKSLSLDQIVRFVHLGTVYRYVRGRLTEVS